MTTPAIAGRPLWYELMTTDMKAAEAFYNPVVGWSTSPFDGAGQPYSMCSRSDGTPVAGVMTLPDDVKARNVPPHWAMYVGVDKLEQGVEQVTKLGGQITSPVIDVPDVGRMQMVQDPQGAHFYLYEPSPAAPHTPEVPPADGDVSWHELYTTDSQAAMNFYTDLFGWKPTEALDMEDMGVYRMFGRNGQTSIGGMMAKTPDMAQVPTSWLVYFKVPDIEAAAERVKANGGQVVMGPMQVPGGSWIVQAVDPQGGHFALHQSNM